MKNHIVVSAEPEYREHESDDHNYVFAYHICIRNSGEQAAQLISRKWLITDANGEKTEVQGEGVLGEQPTIQPQQEHCYSSFSVLKTEVGCMQGSYLMKSKDGELFSVDIPVFTLAVSGVLH
ncbi:MAG: Co2+/Mg2+ efflux protein ApaG [Ghiorsea sp.]